MVSAVGSHSSPNKLCRTIKDIPHAFANVNLQPVSAVMLQAFVAVKEQAKEMTLEVLSNTVIEQVGQVAQEVEKCLYELYYRHGRTFNAHALKLECTCLVLHRRVDFLHHFSVLFRCIIFVSQHLTELLVPVQTTQSIKTKLVEPVLEVLPETVIEQVSQAVNQVGHQRPLNLLIRFHNTLSLSVTLILCIMQV